MTQSAIAPAPRKPSPLSLVTRGVVEAPPRVLVYGASGLGKSTLACSAPDPIVIQGEKGTDRIDVARFPLAQSWADVGEQVQSLIDGEHDFQTLVIDTLDGIEPHVFAEVIAEDRKKPDCIELAHGGYGAGFRRAADKWRELLSRLEELIERRHMGVILVAHSTVKTYQNPEGPDYDRYIPKLNDKAWGSIFAWTDAVLFAQYETAVVADGNEDKGKGVSTGARVLRTVRHAAWEAKNRYGLPDSIPMQLERGWSVVSEYIDAPRRIRAEIDALLGTVSDPSLASAVRGWLANVGSNAVELAAGLQRLKVRTATPAAA